MKRVVQKLYFYYFYAVLALLFLLFYPCFFCLLLKQQWHPHAHALRRKGVRWLFALTGIKVNLQQETFLDPNQVYLFCGNHFSELDILILLNSLPVHPVSFMGKKELAALPFFGRLFRNLDVIVDRENPQRALHSFKKTLAFLKQGHPLVIFPEGGIYALPPQITPFKDGAFELAIKSKVPIVPLSLPDSWEAIDNDRMLGWPGQVHLVMHEPIESKNYTKADLPELKQQVFIIIEETINRFTNASNG